MRYEAWRGRDPPRFLLEEIPDSELPARITGLQLALVRRFLRLGLGEMALKLKMPGNGRRSLQRMEESDRIGGSIVAAVHRLGREALERQAKDREDTAEEQRQPAAVPDDPEEQRRLEAKRVIERLR